MTSVAYETIRGDVLAALEDGRLAPDSEPAVVRRHVECAVAEHERRARLGETVPLGDPAAMVERIMQSVVELGPLTELLARADVEEVFIEGARVSYLDAAGRLRGLLVPTGEQENRQVVERLLAPTDRQLNTKHPIVQARVLDGTARLTAAIPPVGDQLSATVRRYVVRSASLDDLVRRDSLPQPAATVLRQLMQRRSRIVVSGEPGAGKTTLAAALLASAPSTHCVRVCEEIRELAVPLQHGAYYEVRPAALDGSGEIGLRDLVKFVLAMRPDRIVVGEVRGAEAFELCRAVNAGCGFLCTVHANSASDALVALVNAALMAGENVTEHVVRKVLAESIDAVVHVDRDDFVRDGRTAVRRQVMEIAAVVPSLTDDFTLEPLFARERLGAALQWTGAAPPRLERILGDLRSAAHGGDEPR